MRRLPLLVVAALLLPALPAAAQTGADLALALRGNVVAIEARWPSGALKDGFGFIVGAEDGIAYIATARHVVYGGAGISDAPTINVAFFGQSEASVEARRLDLPLAEIDLAAITVAWQANLAWKKEVIAPSDRKPQFGDPVWFIGRNKEWIIPYQSGYFNRIYPTTNEMRLENLPVAVGTSGAPVLTVDGFVGMITRDLAQETVAISIEDIFTFFAQNMLPWDLKFLPRKCRNALLFTYDGTNDGEFAADTRIIFRRMIDKNIDVTLMGQSHLERQSVDFYEQFDIVVIPNSIGHGKNVSNLLRSRKATIIMHHGYAVHFGLGDNLVSHHLSESIAISDEDHPIISEFSSQRLDIGSSIWIDGIRGAVDRTDNLAFDESDQSIVISAKTDFPYVWFGPYRLSQASPFSPVLIIFDRAVDWACAFSGNNEVSINAGGP